VNGKIIELTGLTKNYGSFTAVDNLNLSVDKGEIYGLLGPNGAGKSTTILMMLGLTQPTSGTVRVCGIDPVTNPIEVKKVVGYLPEDVGFYDNYTGLENLIYTARLNSIPAEESRERAKNLMVKVGLSGEENKKAGKYSRGMRQRLGLADVLIKKPEVLILDEPTLGIDPKGVNELLSLIVSLSREEGHTVLLCSHHLHQVQQICDRVGIFYAGKMVAEGDIGSLSRKLLSDDHFVIEAEIFPAPPEHSPSQEAHARYDSVKINIEKIEGVQSVKIKQNTFTILSRTDISSDIARIIINSGLGLGSLARKEFGLDEIYNRYFDESKGKENTK
jgi:ABC-2 type transport system ATP-binding protein